MKRWITYMWAVGLSLVSAGSAYAEPGATPWVESDFGRSRLVASHSSIGPEGSADVWLAWDLELKEGWKTYWRSPGEAGKPPLLLDDGSANLADAELRFPLPKKFTLFGLETYGYEGGALLPIRVEPAAPGDAMRVSVALDYMICKDICVPLVDAYTLELPAATSVHARTPHAARIYEALANVPVESDADAPELSINQASLFSAEDGERLVVRVASGVATAPVDLIAELPYPIVTFGKKVERAGKDLIFSFRLDSGTKDRSAAGQEVVLTAYDSAGNAVERRLTLQD